MNETPSQFQPTNSLVSGFLDEPFDPFAADPSAIGPEDLDDQAYHDVEIPVNLACCIVPGSTGNRRRNRHVHSGFVDSLRITHRKHFSESTQSRWGMIAS